MRAGARLHRRARDFRDDVPHIGRRAEPVPVQPADPGRLRDHREVPDGGGDLPRALLRLSRRRVHPGDLPGRSPAARTQARRQLCRAPDLARVLRADPDCDGAAGLARPAGRYDLERAPDPGRARLLPRPTGLPGSRDRHAARPRARAQRQLVPVPGRGAQRLIRPPVAVG